MVWRQCVACNLKVPGSKKACVCGHVFTETKMIGRKRYSGYRALLCSRNDPRRKDLKRKNTAPRLMLLESKRRLSGSPKTKRRPGKEMSANGEASTAKCTQYGQKAQKVKPSHRHTDFDSPEFIDLLTHSHNKSGKNDCPNCRMLFRVTTQSALVTSRHKLPILLILSTKRVVKCNLELYYRPTDIQNTGFSTIFETTLACSDKFGCENFTFSW